MLFGKIKEEVWPAKVMQREKADSHDLCFDNQHKTEDVDKEHKDNHWAVHVCIAVKPVHEVDGTP